MTDERADDSPEPEAEPEPELELASEPEVAPTSTIRSGERLDKLAELEEERRYLLRSLKDLESERAAGDVDEVDYETLKNGYTVRAASVLRQIEEGQRSLAPKAKRNWKRTIVVSFAVVAFAVAIGAALAAAFGERGANDEITGFNPADDTRTTLANARAALARGDFPRAQQLFVEADQDEIVRGNENAEARTYVGWTTALLARQVAGESLDPDDELLGQGLLALNQAISIDPTFSDPYCFIAIIEFNFRDDAAAALPFVEQCEANNPPADVAALVEGFATEIRAAVEQ